MFKRQLTNYRTIGERQYRWARVLRIEELVGIVPDRVIYKWTGE